MDVEYMKKQIQEAFDREEGVRRLILCCSCSHQDKVALEAFALLFPEIPAPEVVKGRDRIYKLYLETKNEHIKAISKLGGKFSYYIELKDGDIIKETDLTTGKQLA